MKRNAKAPAKAGRGSSFLSCLFTTVTVASLGSAFYLTMSTSNMEAAPSPPREPATAATNTFAAASAAAASAADAAAAVATSAVTATTAEGAAAAAATTATAAAATTAAAAAAAATPPPARRTVSVTKAVVPISNPQGYDAAAQTLTLATWRASGVPYDPALDSPALAQQHGDPAPGLMHKARPPSNFGVVMGLAAYPNDILGKLERCERRALDGNGLALAPALF